MPGLARLLVLARRFSAALTEGKRKSDELKMKLISGLACSALTNPARAFS